MSELTRTRVVVTGRVQGVFFRDSVRRVAVSEGVGGWVRNRSDGAVEAVFEGDETAVTRCVEYCRHGPERALVREVEVYDEEPAGEQAFEITW